MKFIYEIRIGVPSGWYIAVTKPLCKRKAKKYIIGLFKCKNSKQIREIHFNPIKTEVKWGVCFSKSKKDVIRWFKNNRT